MPGVSWNERKPTDWLASNGRWYEASTHPRGWSTSALPPAPGHGGVGSILRRIAETGSTAAGLGSPGDGPPRRPAPQAPPNSTQSTWSTAPPTVRSVPTERRVAEATITDAYARDNPSLPAPPGRIRAEHPEPALPAPPAPPKPAVLPKPAVPASAPPAPSPPPPNSSFEVVAGDLGKVLGTAKKRIEKAINDAAES